MPKASISELLSSSPLMRPSEREHTTSAVRDMRVFRDSDMVRGTIRKGRDASAGRSGALGGRLSRLLTEAKARGRRARGVNTAFVTDARQRVVATVYYQGHGVGAAGRLIAHGKYLERDGAGPDGEKGQLYDRDGEVEDGAARLARWAEDDKRHFRLMLAPESGARIEDLKDFARATMARMERDLGAALEWVAVDHHNTDNPHVHVILRGRRRDGADLIIPRDYVSHGLRHAARDVATEMLGERGPEDERLALDRETTAPRRTRLDDMLEREVSVSRPIRIQAIGRRYEPVLRAALRNRVRELARLGMAQEVKRGQLRFDPDWMDRLERIGASIDLRRRLGREMEGGQRLRLYRRGMGRVEGEVVEFGQRGERAKGYLILREESGRPLLVNVRQRDVDGLAAGAIVAVEPKAHGGAGVRARVDRLSDMPLASQASAAAETELDREILRQLKGERARLPATPEVAAAVQSRIAWHEREGVGRTDLAGQFSFDAGGLERLRAAELANAEDALRKSASKRLINANDGIEREWRVRGFVQLHQGRFAALERNDAVALVRLARAQSLSQGKIYSLTIANGKIKATPSLGLDR